MVNNVGAIGTGAEETAMPLHGHNPIAMPVTQRHPFGGGGECLFDYPGRNAHPVAVSGGHTGLFEQVQCLLVVQAHAGALQDLQTGPVEPLALLVREPSELRTAEDMVIATNVCHLRLISNKPLYAPRVVIGTGSLTATYPGWDR